ncbi:DNA-binding NarL/FixJ family response regulator [Dyadobacter sp. BE34]|uniref:DNA-binding NarL/FixJ family response regulator n=1 Tax=Dyadobacter fermentans TaxID=94254 RepID=A0ABU1R514_9BACT|nr:MULTISPECIES: response regulator transcription factor [Dyadobacter]MDR6808507.1 DNA-binding NarL/FixJ family response regulator [Dyadobacter fermentans]MDR7046250.1 DNA-binding NarL/FixJ family response regulator [Dyadobacter sp. BE242]MDR7200563.1 DNA-binding NarL/FixJ family response regulator [Dyadobacter sp. BE34]MDR7218523.1 DNA-binding NarL/FixJ family response regulator [Dyadobacter sp. BE31]MDR7266453.1 DNA-binding NarL/FixJ family response regulator [Dyadobacter sp. BE32]
MLHVILYDSHPIILRGLKEFFKNLEHEFTFLETGTVAGISKYLANHKVDLVVVGVNEKTGLDAKIIQKYNTIPWVIMYNDNLYKRALSLVLSGASACISKGCPDLETEKCLREVLASRRYICESTLQKFGYEFLFDPGNQSQIRNFLKYNLQRKPNKLSPREQQVAGLLVSGMKTSEIATALNVRHSTVSTIKRTVMLKKNVINIVELASVLSN